MNRLFAAEGSTAPAELRAFTFKTCRPFFRLLYVFGDAQRLNGLPSRLQVKVEPGWEEPNLIVAFPFARFSETEEIVVLGSGNGSTPIPNRWLSPVMNV